MASAAALETPTLQASWRAFVSHLPALLAVAAASTVLSLAGLLVAKLPAWLAGERGDTLLTALGQLGQVPFSIAAAFVGVLSAAVPALHYVTGRVIGMEEAFAELARRPGRTLLAGALFAVAVMAGTLLGVLPGLAVALVMPVFVNLIFTGDRPILEAFRASFQACYGTPQGRSFLLLELLVWLVVLAVALGTCLLGLVVVGPMANFYLQNAAYHRGVLR